MYHYTECGLRNVYLANGFRKIDTDYGEAVSIENVEGLHRAIGEALAKHKPHLTGAEFRFLRKELGLSQAKFGQPLGYEAQSIALWERSKTKLPKWADRMIRQLYLETTAGNSKLIELIERLNDTDRQETEGDQVFEETKKGWVPKVA